jgi:peptidase M1-like protein
MPASACSPSRMLFPTLLTLLLPLAGASGRPSGFLFAQNGPQAAATPGSAPGASASVAPTPPPGVPAAGTPATPAPSSGGAPSGGADFAKDRDAIFDAYYTTGLDTTTAYTVTNLAIKKDNMTLLLKQGVLFLMKPLGGEITGAAFIGEGEAQMTPPNGSVRFMLHKASGVDTLQEPFTEAVFRFSDGTERLLLAAARPDPSGASQAGHAGEVLGARNGWLDGYRGYHFETQFLENRIGGLKGNDFFVGDLHTRKHDWITYVYKTEVSHEHLLTGTAMLGSGRRYLVPWAEWHQQSDYGQGGHYVLNPDRDGPRAFKIEHNDMTLNLPNTKTVEWESRERVQILADNLRALRFDLASNCRSENRWTDDSFWPVKVSAVTDESGAPLLFQHKKDQLLVILPQPARAGTTLTIATKGTADVVYQLTAESFGLLEAPWYPQYGFLGGRATFHWTVRIPRPFLITGSGKTVREFEDKERNQNGIELQSDIPVNFPWVIFGRFQREQAEYIGEDSKKQVHLSVHSFPTMTMAITDEDTMEELGVTQPVSFVLNAPPDKVKNLLNEEKEILKLYEKIYGPFPYDELHLAQMAPQVGFSQSPPGFVQLTGLAFLSQAEYTNLFPRSSEPGDFAHGLYAHETAHQWWGNQIGWASEDDEWLSEGIAEYSSGIFIQAYQKEARLLKTLQLWKKDAKLADKEAPISQAHTLSGPNSGTYRTGLLYAKAPYVWHMLRVLLDDAKYAEVMKSVQEAYKGRNVSTEMVLAQINRASGSNLTWFFDQWIWGTGIPVFRYTWRSEKQPDGKFLVTVHVSQDDKTNFKKVMMPIHVHFRDKTIPQYKMVEQAEQDLKLMSPIEPKNVTLDDDNTLLADVYKANG